MASDFKRGDHVKWNSEAGKVRGYHLRCEHRAKPAKEGDGEEVWPVFEKAAQRQIETGHDLRKVFFVQPCHYSKEDKDETDGS
jgi:hypothetical protein